MNAKILLLLLFRAHPSTGGIVPPVETGMKDTAGIYLQDTAGVSLFDTSGV